MSNAVDGPLDRPSCSEPFDPSLPARMVVFLKDLTQSLQRIRIQNDLCVTYHLINQLALFPVTERRMKFPGIHLMRRCLLVLLHLVRALQLILCTCGVVKCAFGKQAEDV